MLLPHPILCFHSFAHAHAQCPCRMHLFSMPKHVMPIIVVTGRKTKSSIGKWRKCIGVERVNRFHSVESTRRFFFSALNLSNSSHLWWRAHGIESECRNSIRRKRIDHRWKTANRTLDTISVFNHLCAPFVPNRERGKLIGKWSKKIQCFFFVFVYRFRRDWMHWTDSNLIGTCVLSWMVFGPFPFIDIFAMKSYGFRCFFGSKMANTNIDCADQSRIRSRCDVNLFVRFGSNPTTNQRTTVIFALFACIDTSHDMSLDNVYFVLCTRTVTANAGFLCFFFCNGIAYANM